MKRTIRRKTNTAAQTTNTAAAAATTAPNTPVEETATTEVEETEVAEENTAVEEVAEAVAEEVVEESADSDADDAEEVVKTAPSPRRRASKGKVAPGAAKVAKTAKVANVAKADADDTEDSSSGAGTFGFRTKQENKNDRLIKVGERMTRDMFHRQLANNLQALGLGSPSMEEVRAISNAFESTLRDVIVDHPFKIAGSMIKHSRRKSRLSKVPSSEGRFTLIPPHVVASMNVRVDELRYDLEVEEAVEAAILEVEKQGLEGDAHKEAVATAKSNAIDSVGQPVFNIDVVETEDGSMLAGYWDKTQEALIPDADLQAVLDEYLNAK